MKDKSGTAYIRDDGVLTAIVNSGYLSGKTKGEIIGVISEEASHVINGYEGRQIETRTDEKGLESTGRATNEYFKDKYRDDTTPMTLVSDGKDYSGVDFGENMGDKEIVSFSAIDTPWISDKIAPNGKSGKQNAEEALKRENKNFVINWFAYKNAGTLNDSEITYTMKINYYYFQANNRINNLNEYKNDRKNFDKISDAESVFHNIVENGTKIYVGDSPNKKYVNYNRVCLKTQYFEKNQFFKIRKSVKFNIKFCNKLKNYKKTPFSDTP